MEELVKLARKAVEEFFRTGKIKIKSSDKFKEPKGVFVTIYSYPDHELRGCIGFIESAYPLYEAVQRAAVEAAFNDFRFSPLVKEELNEVVFEVSVLSSPKLLNCSPGERIEKIENGKDGLIIECRSKRGLLLPQVWEEIPEKTEFLEALCWKAGLTPDAIYDKNTKLYKFNAEAYKELKPKGKIVKIS
jgi:AmmeMemoRadiSam system protein A